ncbi:MAG: hypothetical protein JW881_04860 [Spirochaetales bacterium]|nr:hypothetical protein [Spirochaetales bacterium]
MGRMTFISFFLLLVCMMLPAEDFIPLGKEAPESLFELEIGDADVDFFLLGSWTFSLLYATGIVIKPGIGVRMIDYFPGMDQGFFIEQVPDLTLSLWLMERYFLELTYNGTLTDNLIIAGYEGKEGELLQHVYIGNTDINISPYPFLNIADIENSSLGAEVLFQTPAATHELLLRYEYSEEKKKTFEGLREIEEIRFVPEQYMRGRFFLLPDSNVTDLSVYLEDNDKGTLSGSDGRTYRKATFDEVVLDSAAGTVSLKEYRKGRILVYYKKNGYEVGTDDPGLGVDALPGEDADGNIDISAPPVRFYFDMGVHLTQDMGARRITLNGSFDSLLLWEKGVFSPFELSGSYPFTDALPSSPGLVDISLVQKGGTREKTGLPWDVDFSPDTMYNRIIAFYDSNPKGDFRNRYPFPDPASVIYGPRRDVTGIHTDYEILVTIKNPLQYYLLEPDIIPGSVYVIRNGIKETRFEVDFTAGILTFLTDISPIDRIEVIYRTRAETMENGDLLFAWGNKTLLNDTTTLMLSAGLRWNALPGSYTEQAYSKMGSLLGSCSFSTALDWLTLTANAGVSFTNPDTTGIFRLLGMEKGGMDMVLSENTVTPSSLPAPYEPALSLADRGRLFYKNYREYGLLGDVTLKEITWDIPDDQIYPYRTGSKTGPYEVRGSAVSRNRSSLVMDFSMPGDDDWVGIQIPADPGYGPVDLTGIESITISYRSIDLSGDIELTLQIGEIDEDIDGDGRLDGESSPSSTGYSFDDTSAAAILKIGGGPEGEGNGTRNSEDTDGNFLLDPEAPGRLVTTSPIGLTPSTTGWQSYTAFLSDSQRELLVRSNFLRVVLTDSTGGDVTGKLLIDRIYLSGPHFWKEITTGDNNGERVSVREIDEYLAPLKPPVPLAGEYAAVREIFHPAGEEQKVCEITWDDLDADESWECINYSLPDTGGIRYDEVTFYLAITELTGAGNGELVFSLLDSSDAGIVVTIPASDLDLIPEWREVTIELDTKEIYLGGERVDWNLSADNDYTTISRFGIGYTSLSSGQDGTLFIDEIHLKRPVTSLGAAFGFDAEINIEGDIVTIDDFPLVSDLRFREKAMFVTEGFSPLYGQYESSGSFSSLSELSIGLLASGLDAHLLIEGSEDTVNVTGGHKLQIPKDECVLSFTDTFTQLPGNGGTDIYRADSLEVGTGDGAFSGHITTEATCREKTVLQNWGLVTGFSAADSFDLLLTESYSEYYTDIIRPGEWYLPAWISAWRYIVSSDTGMIGQRKQAFSTVLSLPVLPVGLEWATGVTWISDNVTETQRTFGPGMSYSLSFPITLRRNEKALFILTPGYRRSLAVEQVEGGIGGLTDDIAAWGTTIVEHPYLFNQLPFLELFSAQSEETFRMVTEDTGCTSATYIPAVTLALSRDFGSHLYDLFVPSSLEYTMSKEMKKQTDLYDFVNRYNLATRIHAINLFGKFGAYRFFDFYTVDEYVTSVNLDFSESESTLIWDISIGNYVRFIDEKQNRFSIDNQLKISEDKMYLLSDTATLAFEWRVVPRNGLSFPFTESGNVEDAFIAHEERLGLTFKDSPDEESFHPLTILLGHTTTFTYPGTGYIKGGIDAGVDIEHIEGGYPVVRVGFKGVIEARLQW